MDWIIEIEKPELNEKSRMHGDYLKLIRSLSVRTLDHLISMVFMNVNLNIFPGDNIHVVHPMGLSYSFSLVHPLPFTFYGFVMHAPPLRLQLPTRGEGGRGTNHDYRRRTEGPTRCKL